MTKFYAFLTFPIRATCSARLILLHVITLIIFGEAYKSWSCTSCSFLQPPACYVFSCRSTHSRQHHLLKHPVPMP